MNKKTTAELMERVGNQIALARACKHLTAEQMCESVNLMDPQADHLDVDLLAGIESGTTDTSASMLLRIISALGYEIGMFRM